MIVFDLSCGEGHRFEGWFGSSDDFATQQARGMVSCPQCGSADIAKAPMAPAVPMKGNRRPDPAPRAPVQALASGPMPAEVAAALSKLAQAQEKALRDSKWVGGDFAEQSRAMHYGERPQEAIHGQTTPEEAQALVEEGVPVAPLPFPVAAPEDLN